MYRFETRRLILRPFCDEDFADAHQYGSDPEVCRYQSWGPNSETETREFLSKAQQWLQAADPNDYEFGIVLRDSKRLIGGCGVRGRRREPREFEAGWTLNRAYWRNGIGTEAVIRLLSFAFKTLTAHRVYAVIDPENVASVRLAEGIGFRREGLQHSDRLVRGEWRDSYIYALLSSEMKHVTGRGHD